jgi:hypothetical protein
LPSSACHAGDASMYSKKSDIAFARSSIFASSLVTIMPVVIQLPRRSMHSSKFAETINGRVQVRDASWKACAPLNVPSTGSQYGGITSNWITLLAFRPVIALSMGREIRSAAASSAESIL